MAKVTDCCGVTAWSNGDSDTMDIGICPECSFIIHLGKNTKNIFVTTLQI